MKRPLSIPIICWTNIAINYLIALGMTLVILAVGTSPVDLGDFYVLLLLPYLNLILVIYLNKMILRGRRGARDLFVAWCIMLNILGYTVFNNIQITLLSVALSLINIVCLYRASAIGSLIRKRHSGAVRNIKVRSKTSAFFTALFSSEKFYSLK